MSQEAEQLKARTMQFALDVCALIQGLPVWEPGPTTKRQLARSATSVALNYRASCRARSHDEFTAKIGQVAEEADESQGWLEFITAGKLLKGPELARLFQESTELSAIMARSAGTARETQRQRRLQKRQRRV